MARYTKNKSTFIERKHHQNIDGGTIVERDWTTLGERHVIEPGKRRVYSDSGFLFTESKRKGIKSRTRTTEWSDFFTSDDLTDNINDDVNIIKLPDVQDVRSYAYYGSAVELVRTSLENISKQFPGKAYTNGRYVTKYINNTDITRLALYNIFNDGHYNYILNYIDEESINLDPFKGEVVEPKIYLIDNPFNFEFFISKTYFNKDENELRNIPYSWQSYYINGRKIKTYNTWIKQYDKCEEDYSVIYEAKVTYEIDASVSRYNSLYDDYGIDSDCIKFSDTNDNSNDCVIFDSSEKSEYEGYIYGLKYGDDVILCTTIKDFTLMPIPSVISNYFSNLDGFERLLLTTKTNPLYNCTLKTPILKRTDGGPGYTLVNRFYKFPSNGYCILCDGIGYINYVNQLYNMAQIMDENYTDNIWQNMTHESIKNFDWTYKKDYEDGDAEENIIGGTRLQEVLRIYGRFFDDIKRYVDGIKLKNCVTLDGVNNLPNAELSDKAQLSGWETYSTKFSENDNIEIGSDFIEDNVKKQLSRWSPLNTYADSLVASCDEQPKWFPYLTPDDVTENSNDNYFMRLIASQAKSIFRYKGTKHAIEMIYALFGLGKDDFTISEKYYTTTPKKSDDIVYAYVINEDPEYTEQYIEITDYTTLESYVNSIGGESETSEKYIKINEKYYDLTEYTFKELCEVVNNNKNIELNYENNVFSGVPLNEITLGDEKYIVPYFSQDYLYDGNVQFQSNGGWGKITDDIEYRTKYDYKETLQYTQVLQNCTSLLRVNKNSIKGKSLYYVIDTSDIGEYVTEDLEYIGHYFKIVDIYNPKKFQSWSNIPEYTDFDSEEDYEDYCNSTVLDDNNKQVPKRPLFYGVKYEDYLYSQYLENLIPDCLGNNPHTGNGIYDLGQNYYDYLCEPFHYSITNNGFEEECYKLMAKKINFSVADKDCDDENIKIVWNKTPELTYYIPNKMLIIENNLNSENFTNYFHNVIFKYISQVIPSTTILVFLNY